jgi:hypothetical protein
MQQKKITSSHKESSGAAGGSRWNVDYTKLIHDLMDQKLITAETSPTSILQSVNPAFAQFKIFRHSKRFPINVRNNAKAIYELKPTSGKIRAKQCN